MSPEYIFATSYNVAEYEALVNGLKIAIVDAIFGHVPKDL